MCNYCDNKTEVSYTIASDLEGTIQYICFEDHKWKIVHEGEQGWYIGVINFNFCPICGRKMEDE